MESFIGLRAAARRLRVHENTVRNWVHEGRLTDARLPGSRYIRVSALEVDQLAEGRTAGVLLEVACSRERWVTSRCVAIDGRTGLTTDHHCVGCGISPEQLADELAALVKRLALNVNREERA